MNSNLRRYDELVSEYSPSTILDEAGAQEISHRIYKVYEQAGTNMSEGEANYLALLKLYLSIWNEQVMDQSLVQIISDLGTIDSQSKYDTALSILNYIALRSEGMTDEEVGMIEVLNTMMNEYRENIPEIEVGTEIPDDRPDNINRSNLARLCLTLLVLLPIDVVTLVWFIVSRLTYVSLLTTIGLGLGTGVILVILHKEFKLGNV